VKINRAQESASSKLRGLSNKLNSIKLVSREVLDAAAQFKTDYAAQKGKVIELVRKSNEHLDYDFIVDVAKRGQVPPDEPYKQTWYEKYGELQRRIERAGLKSTQNSPLPLMDTWKGRPREFDIRVTQKKYWIVKALVDVLTDPDCGVVSVQNIVLDNVPLAEGVQNGPDARKMFWRYPFTIDFIIDFRKFPVFLEKLVGNEEILFVAPGFWKIARSFDEDRAVYVPQVSVSLYCQVWDFISAGYEQQWLRQYENQQARPAAGAARGRGR